MTPRILFVAMQDSIHTVRHISQLSASGYDLALFPAYLSPVHPQMPPLPVFQIVYGKDASYAELQSRLHTGNGRLPAALRLGRYLSIKAANMLVNRVIPPAQQLASAIRRFRPHLIHSLEIQHAGYLTLRARQCFGNGFPPWIVTDYGSDLYYFGRLAEDQVKIKEVMAACNYYCCECARDIALARAFGFQGEVLPVLPTGGGFDLKKIAPWRQPGLPSQRRLIVLKGYQNWCGRALVGLRALELCADALRGYEVAIFSARDAEVRQNAVRLQQNLGIPVRLMAESSHEAILRLHGAARLSIGLGITDGISTSMLEAMVMGSFPIQSHNSCAGEWIEDGVSGFLVPPEDPYVVAAAIRRALAEDSLVDHAMEINLETANRRLDDALIRHQVVQYYQTVYDKTKIPPAT